MVLKAYLCLISGFFLLVRTSSLETEVSSSSVRPEELLADRSSELMLLSPQWRGKPDEPSEDEEARISASDFGVSIDAAMTSVVSLLAKNKVPSSAHGGSTAFTWIQRLMFQCVKTKQALLTPGVKELSLPEKVCLDENHHRHKMCFDKGLHTFPDCQTENRSAQAGFHEGPLPKY